jgi:pyruvate,orthophosphate dikinase
MGRSRDDAESSFLPHYLDTSVVRSSPFQTIDVDGVLAGGDCRGASTCRPPGHRAGRVWRARWGPASIDFFDAVGLDYVSWSPYRMPIARLEAGKAALWHRTPSDERSRP